MDFLHGLPGKQNQLLGEEEEEGILHLLPSVFEEQRDSSGRRQSTVYFLVLKAILRFFSLFNTPGDIKKGTVLGFFGGFLVWFWKHRFCSVLQRDSNLRWAL